MKTILLILIGLFLYSCSGKDKTAAGAAGGGTTTSCKTNYTSVGGACVLSKQTRACESQPSNSAGGTQSTTNGGVTWGACSGFTCSTNYTKTGNSCVFNGITRACVSQPANSTGGLEGSVDSGVTWSSCEGFSCNASFTKVGSACLTSNVSRACLTQPANSTGGTESSTDAGQTYGACTGFSCSASYTNVGGVCALTNDTRACSPQPGNSTGGTQATTNGGATWGACSGFSCSASYTNVSGTCVQTNQSRACSPQPGNSTGGTQASTDGGVTWAACSGFTCSATYTNVSGTCSLTNQTRACVSQPSNSTGGTEATSNGGSTWGTCSSFTCDSGYVVSGSTCVSTVVYNKVSGGWNNTCAITAAGVGYCWGRNDDGELGDGSTNQATSPIAVSTAGVLAGKTLKDISAGYYAACTIASDDNVYCWGYGGTGELGTGAFANSLVPVAVKTSAALSGKTVKQLSMGGDFDGSHTCVATTDGGGYCWGFNSFGQVTGDGTTANKNEATAIPLTGALSGKTIKFIEAGYRQTCAIASDDKVYCWGEGTSGELGDGNSANSLVPVAVSTAGVLSGKTIKKLAARHSQHACVIASDDKVYCWGNNGHGQLGNNNPTVDSAVPVAVDTSGVMSGKTIVDITVGEFQSCAKDSANVMYCWGRNSQGQVGNSSASGWAPVPYAVDTSGALTGKTIKQITSGGQHTCASASDDKLYCWGYNDRGQVGDNSSGVDRFLAALVNAVGLVW